ncbi:unnamed protein product, partial [Discosporangium mesarthrocarpum]
MNLNHLNSTDSTMQERVNREWKPSNIGITPLLVRPRAGTKLILKRDAEIILPGSKDGATAGRARPTDRMCSVCTRAIASYTCPRCCIGYCSSSCYKTHGQDCTEAFFKAHVEKELRVQQEEPRDVHQRRAGMTEILQRLREVDATAPTPENLCRDEAADEEGDEEVQFQQRLEQLAMSLERIGTDGYEGEGLEGLGLLTPGDRTRFLREVASGRLSAMIEPWKPWWTQRIDGAAGVEVLHGDNSPNPVPNPASEPLDETAGLQGSGSSPVGEALRSESCCPRHSARVLLGETKLLPDFSSLSARSPSGTLAYLAVDVAFGYARVLRLYNGCWCEDPVSAAMSLMEASPVLGKGAQPSSTPIALSACVEAMVAQEGSQSAEYAESLGKDVHALCEDPRKLTCAFHDTCKMFDAAATALSGHRKHRVKVRASHLTKEKGFDGTASHRHPREDPREKKEARRELTRTSKRLRFFTLWSSSCLQGSPMGALADEVLAEVERADLARRECKAAAAAAGQERGTVLAEHAEHGRVVTAQGNSKGVPCTRQPE